MFRPYLAISTNEQLPDDGQVRPKHVTGKLIKHYAMKTYGAVDV
jgi:hypothetical protein